MKRLVLTFFFTSLLIASLIGCDEKTEKNNEAIMQKKEAVENLRDENLLTDSRDGKTYKTVKIGNQVWMAENLNFEYAVNNRPWRYWSCYYNPNNDPSEDCETFGRYYTWAAAMDSAGKYSSNGKGCGFYKKCSPTYPVRGICPEGWHLPDTTEWNSLLSAVGGKSIAGIMLKSTSGWVDAGNGTDDYGFSALSAGGRSEYGQLYVAGTVFWSVTVSSSFHAYGITMTPINNSANLNSWDMGSAFSIRCLENSQ